MMGLDQMIERMKELGELVEDVGRPDWLDLVAERNNLSVDIHTARRKRNESGLGKAIDGPFRVSMATQPNGFKFNPTN